MPAIKPPSASERVGNAAGQFVSNNLGWSGRLPFGCAITVLDIVATVFIATHLNGVWHIFTEVIDNLQVLAR